MSFSLMLSVSLFVSSLSLAWGVQVPFQPSGGFYKQCESSCTQDSKGYKVIQITDKRLKSDHNKLDQPQHVGLNSIGWIEPVKLGQSH